MNKFWKWLAALFVSLSCGVLAAFSFQGWESPASNSNKIVAMLLALQKSLVGLLGGTLTGLLFAFCAIGILILAWRHKDGEAGSGI